MRTTPIPLLSAQLHCLPNYTPKRPSRACSAEEEPGLVHFRKCRSLPLEHKQGCRIPTLTHAAVTYVPCTKLTVILSSSGLMSKDLQKAAVNVIGDQACKKFYPVQISSRMVCAGFPHGTVDSCSVSVRAANAAAGPANSCRIPVLYHPGQPCPASPAQMSAHPSLLPVATTGIHPAPCSACPTNP